MESWIYRANLLSTMKTCHFVPFLMVVPTLLFAQVPDHSRFVSTIGTPYKFVNAREKNYFYKNDQILTIKIDRETAIIQKLNAKSLKFTQERIIKDFMPDGGRLETIAEFNGKYYLFYNLWEKPYEQLFYKEINFETGDFSGSDQLLIRTERKITTAKRTNEPFKTFGLGGRGKFDFVSSYDQSKLLIQYRLKPEFTSDIINYDIIGMHVFGSDMKPVWNKEVKMPYTEKKMNNLDYSLDHNGNAYIISTVFEDNTTKMQQDGKPNYHIELIKIAPAIAEFRISPIEIKDMYISNIWIYEGESGQMICSGYYNKSSKELLDADGIFMFRLDDEGKLTKVITHEIPLSVLNRNVSEKVQIKNEKKEEEDKADLERLVLREVIVQNDGSNIIVGEQYFIVAHTACNGNGACHTSYTYHYNDIFLTKINANGSLVWMQKLAKKQTAGSPANGLSYKYVQYDNTHYFLFADNMKNIDMPLDGVPAGYADWRKGYLAAYKVDDKTGKISKTTVFDERDEEDDAVYQFNINRLLESDTKELIIEAKKKKEEMLIKLSVTK